LPVLRVVRSTTAAAQQALTFLFLYLRTSTKVLGAPRFVFSGPDGTDGVRARYPVAPQEAFRR
jgi:hypothetical protein